MKRIEILIDFTQMSEPDRAAYERMCLQFSLWIALNPAEQFARANSSTRRFREFRNAILLGGGTCERGE